MSDGPNPDYRDLLRSPYDPDDSVGTKAEGASELPWVPAVVAAALGAFLVGAFVVYAVVTGPVEEEVLAEETSTTTMPAMPVEATGFPDGFVAVTDEIGARVVATDTSTGATRFAVSTVVAGNLDPADVEPLDVAFWIMDGGAADFVPMVGQYVTIGSLGNVTVEFPPMGSLEGSEIIPYLSSGRATSQTLTVDLDATVPQVLAGMMIDFGDGMVVVIDGLTIGDGWGWVEWSTQGGAAIVDVIVTFEGTDDPGSDMIDETRLASAHRQPPGFFGVPVPPPLYGFTGSASLVRVGEPLSSTNSPTAITVDITATMPDAVVQASPIPLPSGG